jgi:hypothetical protein
MFSRAGHPRYGALANALRFGILLLPALMLGACATRVGEPLSHWLVLGLGVQLVGFFLYTCFLRHWNHAVSPTVIVLYLTALAWCWFNDMRNIRDWFVHFTQALLVITPLGVLFLQTLLHSGVLLHSQARGLVRALRERKNWPADLGDCRDLPEVKALREAIVFDAAPALSLLTHERAQVRLAALAALEFRKHWRHGQPGIILALLRRENYPDVRMAAISALGNLNDRPTVEALTESLRDPDLRVRKMALNTLLWDAERRWSWLRYGVRRALMEPGQRDDGALLPDGQKLPEEAVKDFTAWAAQKGMLGLRAAQTLGVHYGRAMHDDPDAVITLLRQVVKDQHAPPLLRMEMGRLLREAKALENPAAEALLDSANPAMLRLLAAETLLSHGTHIRSMSTLRELARMNNRDLVLATAEVVQRSLGVDLGLALGQGAAAVTGPRAIDVMRRLAAWANKPDFAEEILHGKRSGAARMS